MAKTVYMIFGGAIVGAFWLMSIRGYYLGSIVSPTKWAPRSSVMRHK